MPESKPSNRKSSAQIATPFTANPVDPMAWVDVMTESTRFVTDRLAKDFETQQALLACKSPIEVMQVQTEFFQTAVQHYTAEATRMFEAYTSVARAGLAELHGSHARKYDDVPL